MTGLVSGPQRPVVEPPRLFARVFESEEIRADEEAVERLQQEVGDVDLAAPPVAMPDFHLEKDMEAPCSIAVATRGTIRLSVSNAAVNCGMALMTLDGDRPSEEAVEAFYRRVREQLPYPSGYRRQLTSKEVLRAATEGSGFAVERYGVDPAELDRVEEEGRLDVEPFGGAHRVRRELPALTRQLSRLEFGTVGPSNHFIELQEVEEILDPSAAELLGIAHGQITIQYHAGGGILTGLVGRMFGRRLDYPRKHRAIMAVQKPLQHLATARSIDELRLRRALYFSDGAPPIPREGTEGDRVMLANAAAMNYGFAYRLAVYADLRRLAEETLGASGTELIVDSPHDTLYEEEIDGAPALVHRYKTSRAFPAERMSHHPIFGRTGQPILLPGTNRTSSYLCVADRGAAQALYSTCHGTGSIISDLERRGISGPDPKGRHTMRFRYSDEAPMSVAHLDDRGVDGALDILTRHQIARPVARLRPFAVLT
jgi:tRNA-splicing ligase RtcB